MEKKDEDKKSKTVTAADKIWEEIKELHIDMFTLPDQTIQKFCAPVIVEPTKLYLTYTVGSILPALEEALSAKFTVEQAQKYLIISRK